MSSIPQVSGFCTAEFRFDSSTDLFEPFPEQSGNTQVISEYFACLLAIVTLSGPCSFV